VKKIEKLNYHVVDFSAILWLTKKNSSYGENDYLFMSGVDFLRGFVPA